MAVDFLLEIEGVKGESADAKHKGAIDIESWSFGATNPTGATAGGGGGSGKVSVQDFSFVAHTSVASPVLMTSCSTGKHIKKAVLFVRKAGKEQQEYLTFTMTDLFVSSYGAGASSGDDLPQDQFSLNFASLAMEIKIQNADGSLSPGAVGVLDSRR